MGRYRTPAGTVPTVTGGDPTAGPSPLVLATGLAPYWEAHGQFQAGRETLESALASVPASTAERAAAYGALATLTSAQGDLPAAVQAHRQALTLHEECGDRAAAAASRNALAVVLLRAGDLVGAAACAGAALQAYRALDDVRGEAFAHSSLGLVAAATGGPAEVHLLTSVRLFRQQGARREAAAVLANLGNLMQDRGDHQRAARFYDGAWQLFEQLGDRRGAALCRNNLAMLAQARGDLDHAVELAEQALQLFVEVGDRHGEAAMRNNLAGLWEAEGVTDEAWRYYEAAIRLFTLLGDQEQAATARHNLSRLRAPDGALSPRERQVTELVAAGLANREIARRLFVSQRTVESHLAHIFTKLCLGSRTQLALWATRQGLGSPAPEATE